MGAWNGSRRHSDQQSTLCRAFEVITRGESSVGRDERGGSSGRIFRRLHGKQARLHEGGEKSFSVAMLWRMCVVSRVEERGASGFFFIVLAKDRGGDCL